MAKKINFYKMVASGNDFIVIDHRKPFLKGLPSFAKKVCHRQFGVGADGLLLMEKSKKAAIRMRILNSDGSEAEMCGNGARCAALFAHKILGFSSKFVMETKAGLIPSCINAWTVQVELTKPKGYRPIANLKIFKKDFPYYHINTGVPHVVSFVEENLDEVQAGEIGREVRFHSKFQPRGANVNFVKKTGAKSLSIRTYERGVEAETLACGTGSVASAVVAVMAGLLKSPVDVKTKSGEVLKINFNQEGETISQVTLEGNAEFTFEGSLSNVI